jgi:putative FmdB family regulatory protein
MPIYEYACPDCSARFEELVRSPEDRPACPSCGEPAVERLISRFAPAPRAATAPDYSRLSHHVHSGGCCGGAHGHAR